jgi:NTE family protein/lysophospholipid hydrolase
MTAFRLLSSQDQSDFLEQFKLTKEQAAAVLPDAQLFEAETGEDLITSDQVFVLLSGRVVQGDASLSAPILIPRPLHAQDDDPWIADGPVRCVVLDRHAFTEMLVAAVADGSELPGFEPVFSEHRALHNSVEQGHILAGLPRAVGLALQAAMTLQHFHGGERILNEGDRSDALYIVLIGRLIASRKIDGNVQKLAEFGPSDVIGEIGLMVDIDRTADISAMRDSLLARLSREDFERLLIAYPIELTRVFGRAIYSNLEGTKRARARMVATTTMLVPFLPADQADRAAETLRDAFSSFGSCALIRVSDFQHIGGGTSAILAHLGKLESETDNILLLADSTATDWTRLAARQADKFAFLVGNDPIPDPDEYKGELLIGEPSTFANHCIVRVNPSNAALPGDVRLKNGRALKNTQVYPVREGNQADFERNARFLSGRAVGLVLGGGAARGLAHIGVLRAMEELNIPIDLLGGNSMGALIAAQYAFGVSPEHLLKTTRRLFSKGERPAFPSVSLLSGRGMERGLTELFEDIQIEQLWRPFFAVACSISKARVVTLDRGPLRRAVRASNSPAGLLPPVPHNGELLIDGAVLNNVPTDVMRTFVGEGKVIGVAVDKREELMVSPELQRMTPLGAITARGMPDGKRTPRITEILARAGAVGGVAARARLRPIADIWLEPPVSNYSLIAYHKAAEIAEIGYVYAMKELANE